MKGAGALLLPVSLVCGWLAFRSPEWVEQVYAQRLYPLVARGFAAVNFVPFSLAEITAPAMIGLLAWGGWQMRKRQRPWPAAVHGTWVVLGVFNVGFLLTWGCNYARPSLRERMGLEVQHIDRDAVFDAGLRTAAEAARLFGKLESRSAPTTMRMSFEELGLAIDSAYERIRLPGDTIRFRPAPTKRLWSSMLFSYLGISGIYIPFTGEPSVNALQPDVSLPLVVAHEKAHQRGITDEGEANFAAFLACADPGSPPYARYAAFLFAARYLLGSSSRYVERDALEAAWNRLGDGPLEDVRAIRDFWAQYQGPATLVATQVNDRYLRAMQVPEGVESYGTVVSLLIALDRRRELVEAPLLE